MATSSLDQSEYDFLSLCTDMQKTQDHDWYSLVIQYSSLLDQRELIRDVSKIDEKLTANRQQAMKTFQALNTMAKKLQTRAVSYIFSDNDIILCADLPYADQRARFYDLKHTISDVVSSDVHIDIMSAKEDGSLMMRFAADKMMSSQRMRGFHAIAGDESKRKTIDVRRKGRRVPLVMLVEDDRFSAGYAMSLLARENDVFHVRTGEEAVAYYLDYAPDVVLIDVHLPGMHGTDVLQMIKAIDLSAHCVMVSVDNEEGSVIKSSRNGAYSYLLKPYSRERLLWTVRQSPHVKGVDGIQAVTV